jgi:hypothetical protein
MNIGGLIFLKAEKTHRYGQIDREAVGLRLLKIASSELDLGWCRPTVLSAIGPSGFPMIKTTIRTKHHPGIVIISLSPTGQSSNASLVAVLLAWPRR